MGPKVVALVAVLIFLQFGLCAYLFFPDFIPDQRSDLKSEWDHLLFAHLSFAHFSSIDKTQEERSEVLSDLSDLFERFIILDNQSLLSQEEEEEYNFILSNEKALIHASEYLVDLKTASYDRDLFPSRMKAMDLLKSAIAWRENPKRRQAISAILKVLAKVAENEHFFPKDCIELFEELFHHAPDEVSLLLQNVSGTPQERVLRHAMEMVHFSIQEG